MNNQNYDRVPMPKFIQIGMKTFDKVMKQILDLGQSSLSENQFLAFRKMAMDFFADGKRSFQEMEKGRCGESKNMAKGVVYMDE
ncbi:MAG: hypothetical protein H7A32_04775 [Deltaproteobacteria bacterium]|nr:hypothetical protein [Deltaproteobacteria bacterium]